MKPQSNKGGISGEDHQSLSNKMREWLTQESNYCCGVAGSAESWRIHMHMNNHMHDRTDKIQEKNNKKSSYTTGKNHWSGDWVIEGEIYFLPHETEVLWKLPFEQVYFSFIQPFRLNVTLLINTLINLVKAAPTDLMLRADTARTPPTLISWHYNYSPFIFTPPDRHGPI